LTDCGGGSPALQPTNLYETPDLTGTVGNFTDATWRTTTVTFNNGKVTVGIASFPYVVNAFTIAGFSTGTKYYYGFSGATGTTATDIYVKETTITFPTPRCL